MKLSSVGSAGCCQPLLWSLPHSYCPVPSGHTTTPSLSMRCRGLLPISSLSRHLSILLFSSVLSSSTRCAPLCREPERVEASASPASIGASLSFYSTASLSPTSWQVPTPPPPTATAATSTPALTFPTLFDALVAESDLGVNLHDLQANEESGVNVW
jgi:hypothetical protein